MVASTENLSAVYDGESVGRVTYPYKLYSFHGLGDVRCHVECTVWMELLNNGVLQVSNFAG